MDEPEHVDPMDYKVEAELKGLPTAKALSETLERMVLRGETTEGTFATVAICMHFGLEGFKKVVDKDPSGIGVQTMISGQAKRMGAPAILIGFLSFYDDLGEPEELAEVAAAARKYMNTFIRAVRMKERL